MTLSPKAAGAANPEGAPSEDRAEALALAAVWNRDETFDGRFVYAVRTTGIFCRPSCPSRRPRRENVSIHPDAKSAAALGFRPCKRCRPEADGAGPAQRTVAEACARIDAAEAPPSLEALAASSGFSAFHFHRMFRRVTGLTPRGYAEAGRKRRLAQALETGASVTSALYDAGYGAPSRFYASAGKMLGMAPSIARRGGAGERMRFAVAPSALGLVLVASTTRGVCAILLGEDADALEADLRRRFWAAELERCDEAFRETVAAVVALVEAPAAGADLPLDIRGTVFQERVWRALADVPAGATVSYAELARRIGRPGASRAVAQACAANPLAVAVPCHRVVRADGGLSGYRWGPERKRALLERERS